MSNVKKLTWHDIDVRTFNKIQDIVSEPDEYTTYNLLDELYGIDSINMPVKDLQPYHGALEFLNTDIPEVKIPKKVTVNGHEYNCDLNLTVMSVAQFLDYQNYAKQEPAPGYQDVMSVFFIPVGHKYNDGYDIQEVKDDILTMPITTVKTASFFFASQLVLLLTLFQYYLTQSVKKMGLKKEEEKRILDQLEGMDLASLVSFHSSLGTAK